ncbi:MAG: hypothetical protein KR126chlam1_00420 [Chlamydiae bacterium]|nr:hypothetical protein [Chlamydiota bacterium]
MQAISNTLSSFHEGLHPLPKRAILKSGYGFSAALLFPLGPHPLGAAIFAGVQTAMQELLPPGVKQHLTQENVTPTKVYIFVVSYLISTIVGIGMATAFGFPVSFPSAVLLNIFMYPAQMIVDAIYNYIYPPSPKPTSGE